MRIGLNCILVAAVLGLNWLVGCSGGSSLPAVDTPGPGFKALSEYDPFAPAVEIKPLAEAIADSPGLTSGQFSVTALDSFSMPDTGLLDALDLSSDAGRLSIALSRPLTSVALYLSFDAENYYVESLAAGYPGGIGYALEYEPGRVAIGVSGIHGSLVPAGTVIASVVTAEGSSASVIRHPSITQDIRSAVGDLEALDNGDGSVTLGWSERNTGDYDLNREVNISDITPVGLRFNRVYGVESEDYAQLEVVDGDGNFEINISDLTPIGLNFGSIIIGYNVYRTPLATQEEIPDPEDSGRWTKVENELEPAGPSAPRDYNGQDFRLRYSFMDSSDVGDFGWYVAPTGFDTEVPPEGPASNVVTLRVGGNDPPPARLIFEIMPPDGPLMNVGNEFYVAVKVEGVEELFSANVRFEYDSGMVEYIEGVPAYDSNVNFLEPPLFLDADDIGPAESPYVLLGFNATQTQGTATKTGDGALGYFKFRATGDGINEDGFRFPQASTFIYLWGDQYGVPTATPVLGPGQLLNIGL